MARRMGWRLQVRVDEEREKRKAMNKKTFVLGLSLITTSQWYERERERGPNTNPSEGVGASLKLVVTK